ncbi:MAG: DUF371 domain-containing protein [Candidatus Bathyarchaeia archaeon]
MKVTETLEAQGHRRIRAIHPTTFEFTREPHLTWRGDCIIGVKASKAASDLSDEFKTTARSTKTMIHVMMEGEGLIEEVLWKGHRSLAYTDAKSLVVRRSGYTCGRTLMICSNKAARDISRTLVDLMRNPKARMEITLTADTTG